MSVLEIKMAFPFTLSQEKGQAVGMAKNGKSSKTEGREKNKYGEMDLSLDAEDAAAMLSRCS